MASNNFTSGLKQIKDSKLNKNILSAVKELRQIYGDQTIQVLEWNDYYVTIPLYLKINLPTRGPINGLDIKEIEPIVLFINKNQYPLQAPFVYSNRIDFPKSKLPHLNPQSKGMPANFCLYRGDLNSWFIEHSLKELIDKAKSWLEDAASGNLVREYDRFEVTRIDDKYGYNVFELSEFINIVEGYWNQHNKQGGHIFLNYKLLNGLSDPLVGVNKYSISFDCIASEEMINGYLKYAININQILEKCDGDISSQALISQYGFRLFGILVWPPKDVISDLYFTDFPQNLDELLDLANSFNIDLYNSLKQFFLKRLNLFQEIPITVAIPRPQKLIKSDSNIEFLTFLLKLPSGEVKEFETLKKTIYVEILGHINPLSVIKAREISGNPTNLDYGNLLFLGSGAIGSKIILHLARNGFVNSSIIDNDLVYPHNLVRYGLIHESLGWNKAKAISSTIKGIFYADEKSLNVEAIPDNVIDFFKNSTQLNLKKYNWIVDTTASPLVFHLLTKENLPDSLNVCRCEIANSGNIGIMYVEGSKRKPRLDDLQVLVFDMAIDYPEISKWLQLNRDERELKLGSRLQEVNLGISCSSDTMRLSDEIVSLHSASFTAGFKRIAKTGSIEEGFIQLNFYNDKEEDPFYIKTIRIPQTIVMGCRNSPDWKVRIHSGIDKELKQLLEESKPNETGGFLIGLINKNRKTIYITRILRAPPDSISSPYAFVRGTSDIPDEIQKIEDLTGAMIGYIGEWHTHPDGLPSLSSTDSESVETIKHNLDKVPMPAFIMIVTENGLYPYIYPAE